jgi:hypothetical protein
MAIENGIHLKNVVIKKISGPVSMYYLIPNKDIEHTFYKPPILLFGDVHRSYENMCEPCHVEDGCYAINQEEFFKKIDECATFEIPIEFYTEAYLDRENNFDRFIQGFEGGILSDIISMGSDCFKQNMEKCPTKNIRWHYSDPRLGQMHNELTIESAIHIAVDAMNAYIPFFTENPELVKDSKKFLRMFFRENNFIPSDELKSAVQHIMSSILSINGRISRNLPQTFSSSFFDMIKPTNSLIAKQIKKNPHISFETWKFIFAELISASLLENKEVISSYKYIKPNLFQQYGTINMLDNIPDQHFEDISDFILILLAPLLDIYTIARMFKIPSPPSVPSVLNVGLFGDSHVRTMVHILTDNFDYTVVYKKEQEDDEDDEANRCLNIDKPINIQKDINETIERIKPFIHLYHFSKRRKSAKKTRKSAKKTRKSAKKTRKSVKLRKSVRK